MDQLMSQFHTSRLKSCIYISILVLILMATAALPIVSTTVSIRTTGVTRPLTERTEIKPSVTGILDSLYVKEGDTVQAGQLLIVVKDNTTLPKATLNSFDVGQRQQFVQDLTLLTTNPNLKTVQVATPLYRQQLGRHLYQRSELETGLKKARHELTISQKLHAEEVMSQKELFDKQIEVQRLEASFQAFQNEQLTSWQADLQRYQMELSQLSSQKQQIQTEQKAHEVRSPVSGVVQGIGNRYRGGYVQAGESLCVVTPLGDLVGECYATTRDVGLIKVGQPARFQVDAFDYNYFGVLRGKVISVDNDYTLVDGKPVFKVRCSFDTTQLHLKNGFTGKLQKGLTFQARFVVAERTLWQLLFDTIDDWLNPVAPPKPQKASL
jgi:HlyD family secretion protein